MGFFDDAEIKPGAKTNVPLFPALFAKFRWSGVDLIRNVARRALLKHFQWITRAAGNICRFFPFISRASGHDKKSGETMPLGRYFVFVGSVLLALLFLSDRYMPEPIAPSARADVDRSVIRIHSRHKWPEAVVYDASLPTIVPPVVAADVAAETSPREAFAQLPPEPRPARLQVAETLPKPAAVRRTAKTRTPVRRVASYQPFELRGVFPAGW